MEPILGNILRDTCAEGRPDPGQRHTNTYDLMCKIFFPLCISVRTLKLSRCPFVYQ